MKITVGTEIRLTEPRHAWYSGYGANPVKVIDTDEIGVVQAVDVPSVRAGLGIPKTYNVARFGEWQIDFQPRQVVLVDSSSVDEANARVTASAMRKRNYAA